MDNVPISRPIGNHRSAPTPITLDLKRAADAVSLSYRSLWLAVRAGELPSIRVGRKLLVRVTDLHLWLDRQQNAGDRLPQGGQGVKP